MKINCNHNKTQHTINFASAGVCDYPHSSCSTWLACNRAVHNLAYNFRNVYIRSTSDWDGETKKDIMAILKILFTNRQ